MSQNSLKGTIVFMLTSIVLLLTGCSEVVDLNIGAQNERIVIFGKVTDGTAGNELSIAFTSPVGGEQEPVSEADAVLLENGNPIGRYEERAPGQYRLNLNGDSARTGRTYELQVTLRDGTQYRSQPAIMPALAAIDHPRFEAGEVLDVVSQNGIAVEQRQIRVFLDTEVLDQSRDFYLKWDTFEAYSYQERLRVLVPPQLRPPCYIFNITTGQEIYLFNGEELKVDVVRDQLISSSKLDSRFAFDYYYGIVQSTIDRNAHEYWTLVDEISNSVGSIFDTPPGPVPGNFRNVNDPNEEVLGYFEVARSDTTYVRVRGDDLPFFVPPPCPGLPLGGTEPASCTDCLLVPNSSYARPYFWF